MGSDLGPISATALHSCVKLGEGPPPVPNLLLCYWDQGTSVTAHNAPRPPRSLPRHAMSVPLLQSSGPFPLVRPHYSTGTAFGHLHYYHRSSFCQSCFPDSTHHNLKRDRSKMPVAPLPKTKLICFYVTCCHLPFFSPLSSLTKTQGTDYVRGAH